MTARQAFALAALVTATGCYRTVTRVEPTDAGPDTAVAPCEADLNGRWLLDYAPECGIPSRIFDGSPLADGALIPPIDVTQCNGEGCTPANCAVRAFAPPSCERVSRLAWPCRRAGRNSSSELVQRVVSPDRIESVFRATIDGNEIPECRLVMRRLP